MKIEFFGRLFVFFLFLGQRLPFITFFVQQVRNEKVILVSPVFFDMYLRVNIKTYIDD